MIINRMIARLNSKKRQSCRERVSLNDALNPTSHSGGHSWIGGLADIVC